MMQKGVRSWRTGAFAVVVCLLLAAASVAAAERKPNIIFILADDLGYGDTGFSWQHVRAGGTLGAVPPTIATPNLDRLAREGVTLTSHYCAAPVCAPSRASLLTGRVQGACSLRDNCFDRPFTEKDTLGTVMRSGGYATWAVGKWGVAGGGESRLPVASHPLDKGFDYYYGFLDHMAGHTYYHYRGHFNNAFMGITENRTDATDTATGVYSTDLFTAKVKQLIEEHAAREPDKPFFLYLAVNTIHGSGICDDTLRDKTPLHVPGRPYPAEGVTWPVAPEPPEARNTWIDPQYANLPAPAARYATAITRFDNAVGDLMRDLKRLGLARDTMLVFTSDNGPADEYGADPRTFDSNGPFDGLKRDVYEGGMRVPCLVHWPARIAAGTVDDAPSQFHDWMATLADVAGVPAPAGCEGVSLLPRWKGAGEGSRFQVPGSSGAAAENLEPKTSNLEPKTSSLVYTQYNFPWGGGTEAFREFAARKGEVRGLQQMVRVGDYVALRTRIGQEGGGKVRLYNVVRDPFEETDLADRPEEQARLRELTALLDERLAK